MADWSVAAGLARSLFDFAVANGANPGALEAQAGLRRADLEDPDLRLPFAAYVALTQAAKALTGDSALSLRFGAEVELTEFSILGFLRPASASPQDGVTRLNQFSRLLVDFGPGADRFCMERRNSGLWFVDRRDNPNAFPDLTESTFARIAGTRRLTGGPPIAEVVVTHAPPPHAAEYARILGAPVRFSGGVNALRLDEERFARTLPPASRYGEDVMRSRAEGLLHRLEKTEGLRGRVEASLLVLPAKDANLSAVARRLGLSGPTLYRRLRDEGITFEQLLTEHRRSLAMRCLRDEGLSVERTAHRLGYADRAAFSRAFKRWTGQTPAAFGR